MAGQDLRAPLALDEVDVDWAIRETADAVALDTRASFLRKAGIGVSAFRGDSSSRPGKPEKKISLPGS